jgi:hypothetical protein
MHAVVLLAGMMLVIEYGYVSAVPLHSSGCATRDDRVILVYWWWSVRMLVMKMPLLVNEKI